MATIRRRGRSWHVQVRRQRLPALTRSFSRRSDAELWARQRETEIDRGDLPVNPRELLTRSDTFARLSRQGSPTIAPTISATGSTIISRVIGRARITKKSRIIRMQGAGRAAITPSTPFSVIPSASTPPSRLNRVRHTPQRQGCEQSEKCNALRHDCFLVPNPKASSWNDITTRMCCPELQFTILKRFRGSIDPDKSGGCGGGRPLPQRAAYASRLSELEMISTRGPNASSDSNVIVAVFVGAALHHAPPAPSQANGCMVLVVPAGPHNSP